jgi:hypothetical protein
MRLSFPRIMSLQSDDGAASIVFQSTDMNRDTGGFKYLFRFATASRSGCSTSSPPTAGKRPRCSPASGRWPATGR